MKLLSINKQVNFIRDHFQIIIILLVACIVSIIFYTGFYASDDVGNYIPNIYQALNGEVPDGIVRLPLIIAGVISYYVFGQQLESLPVLFALMHPFIIFLTYLIVGILAGRNAAILSSLLILGQSVFFIYGGSLLPDNLNTVLVILAYLSFIGFYKADKKYRYLFAVLCSLFILFTYLMKEPYLLVYSGFLPLAFYYEKSIKLNIKRALLLAVILAGFYIIYKLIFLLLGTPFTLTTIDVSSYLDEFREANIKRGTESFTDHFILSVKRLLVSYFEIIQAIVIIISLIYGIYKRNLLLLVFPIAYFSVFLFLACGSVSLKEFIGFPVQIRYFAPLHAISAIAVGVFFESINFRKNYKKLIIFFALIAFLLNIYFRIDQAGNIYHSVEYRLFNQTVNMLNTNRPGYPIYYEENLNRYGRYYLYKDGNNDLIRYNNKGKADFGKGGLFIFSFAGADIENNNLYKAAQQYADEKNYTLVLLKDSEPYIKPGLKPFIRKGSTNINKNHELWYGMYIHDTKEKMYISNYSFETWDDSIPEGWKRRDKVIQDIKKSNDSFIDNYSVQIFSGKDSNYLFLRHPIDSDDILKITANVYVKVEGNAKASLSLTSEYNDAKENQKVSAASTSTEWNKIGVSIPIKPKCKSVVVQITSVGEGSILADNVEVFIE